MWMIFTVATTVIWGIAELFYKKGANENEKYSHLKICACVGTVMGIHAVFTLIIQDVGYDPVNIIKYFPVSLCYIVSMALSFFGIRYIEESISDPIENTSGALCALMCALFMHERIKLVSIAAIAIILMGLLGVGFLENNGDTDRKKKLGKKMAVIAFLMPFGYAVIDALGSFLDIFYLEMETSPLVGVTADNIETVANTSYELTFAICALLIFIFLRIKNVKFEIAKQGDKMMAAVCETAGQLTYVYAMSGNGAIAAPVISSVCVISLLLSRIFLKEKLAIKQYIFIFMVIAGIILLAAIEGD